MAQEEIEGHVVVDGAWIDKGGEVTAQHFALKVRGDSMISAGIGDGSRGRSFLLRQRFLDEKKQKYPCRALTPV